VAPLRRSQTGAIAPITKWSHCGDHQLASLRRSRLGSIAPISNTALMGLKILNLSLFITVLFAFVGVIICLVSIVFLFSEGPIFTSALCKGKSIPQVGKTTKGKAS
jgi:hypothetical protein